MTDLDCSLLPEAPASATIKVVDNFGYEVLLTVRDFQMSELLTKLDTLRAYLAKHNYQPAGSRSAAAAGGGAGAPSCEFHGPMKPSTKEPGTFFCSAKMGDGSYCKSKA